MKSNRKTMMCAMAAAIFGTIGCAAQESEQTVKPSIKPAKVLIACYSYSGNTKFAAEQIQKLTGGTLFEIKPVKAYPADYNDCVDQAKKEIRAGEKPQLASKVENMKQYDVIFVGSPNLWGTMAPPVATFLSSYDLKGKIVVPFFTHGGGGMQNCESDVRKLCGTATVLKAATFSGSSIRRSAAQIADWVKSVVTLPDSKTAAK